MARPVQYQKLSLQLDAENKKLKAKLANTKKDMSRLKGEASKMQKGFGSSIDQMGGKAGMLKAQMSGLVQSVTSMHPAVLALAGAGAALGLMFQDLTAFTNTWKGSLTDAGRELASIKLGFKSFFALAAEQRGKALAEGGIFGWVKEGASQLLGLTNGMTQAAVGASVGVASVVNDAMLVWQKGLLETTAETSKLKAETQLLYNQFRNTALLPEERLRALDEFKEKAIKLFKLQKANAENELDFLEQQSKLQGNSFEDNLQIEQKKAEIAEVERQHLRLLGRSIEFETSINKAIQKNIDAKKELVTIEPKMSADDFIKSLVADKPTESLELGVSIDDLIIEQLEQELALKQELAEIDGVRMSNERDFAQELIESQGLVIEGYTGIAEIVGQMANGIANAKDNWAALGAVALSSFARIVPKIQEQIKLIKDAAKVKMAADQAAGVSGAVKAGAGVPFPGNLVAIATGVATVLGTIAPFIGSFAKGTDFVPQTGMAMVHKGEKIIPASQNRNGGGQLVAVVSGTDLKFILDEENRVTGNTF